MIKKKLKKTPKSKAKNDRSGALFISDTSSLMQSEITSPRNILFNTDQDASYENSTELQDLSPITKIVLPTANSADDYDFLPIEIVEDGQNHLQNCHYIYALYKFNPEECLYNSLKLAQIGSDNRILKKFEKFSKLDGYCQFFDPNIKIFSLPLVAYNGWNGYIQIKLSFESPSRGPVKENWENDEQARWINPKSKYSFLFSLQIVPRSYTLSSVNPDGESVNDPLQELSIYSDFLFKNKDLEEAFPMLIEQFKAKYENNLTESSKNSNAFFRILEDFMSENASLSIDHFRLLLSLISCIPHSLMQYRDFNFSQFLILLENTDKLQDLESHSHSLEGLVHLMIFSIKENKENWRVIFNTDLNDNLKFSILNHIFEDLRRFRIPLTQEVKEFMIEIIRNFKWVNWTILFRNLAIHCLNCNEFLTNLQNFMLSINAELSLNEFKDVGDCFVTLINEYFQSYLSSMNDVINFFEVISSLDKRFTYLLYSESLKSIIWSILNQNTEKIEFRLNCYKSIFTTYHNSFFSDDMYAAKLSDKLMKEFSVPFFTICNIFSLKAPFFELFEKWVDEIMTKKWNIKEIISYFCKQMKEIVDKENIDRMHWIFVEKLLVLCKRKNTQFLNCAQYFEDCELEPLKLAYIEIELRDENEKLVGENLSDSQKKCKVLETFFKVQNLPTIATVLIEKQLSLMKYDNSELSSLFNKPEKQIAWTSILSSYENYKPFEYTQSLVLALLEAGDKIAQENIALYEIDIIDKQSESQKSIMINLLCQCWCIQDPAKNLCKEEEDYSKIIKNIINKRKTIEKSFEIFGNFINHFHDIMEEYENIEDICKEFKKNYLRIKLADFKFPEKMEKIIEISQEIGPAINSYIFNNYYLPKCKELLSSSIAKLDIYTISSNCKISYKKMKTHLSNLFSYPSDYPMKKVIKVFSNIKSIDNEMIILGTIVPSDEKNINILRDCLNYYQLHDDLINACHGIIDFNEITGDGDPHAIELCIEYTQFSLILHNSTIGQFLEISSRMHRRFANLSEAQKKALIDTFQAIKKSKELVLFLRDLSLDMVQNMKGNVNEYENEFVSTKIVLNLENLWYCIQDIRKYFSNFTELCKLFESSEGENEGKNYRAISQQLLICAPQLCAITELHTQINCKEEAKKKQISEIAKNSTFVIKFENEEYDIVLKYSESFKKSFSIADINELKCRAQLMMHTSQSFEKQKDEYFEYFPIFVDYANYINSIIVRMNELYQNGYPVLEDKLNVPFGCSNGNYQNVSELEEEIFNLHKTWEIDLSYSYLNHFWLTFLSGKQFWILESYIMDSNCEKRTEAQNILKFMGKNIEISAKIKLIREGTPGDRLIKLGEILDKTSNPKKQSFVLDHSEKSLNFQGEIILLNTTNFLNGIFSIYKHYVGYFPKASQIFFCKSSTHWRELKSFLYRYFKDPYNNIYSLINCENLSQDNQTNFKALFNELYGEQPTRSGLAIITSNFKCYLLQYFKDLTVPKVVRFTSNHILNDDAIKTFIDGIDANSRVVTSTRSGLGKTTNMKYQAWEWSTNLITFPIGGDISFEEVCKMLSKLDISPEKGILHLNVSYTSNPSLLNEILINICLLRTLCASETIFVLDRNCLVWIEIANTYGDSLLKSLEYLKFVTPSPLDKFKIDQLIVDEPMLFVGKYLKIYDSLLIDEKNNVDDVEDLPQYDLVELIKTYFITLQNDKDQVTYSQLHIFKSIFYRLMLNFERSPFTSEMIKSFKANLENNNLGFIAKEYSNMRTMIFESLLGSTKEFTTKYISNVKEIQEKSSEKISKNQIDDTDEISSLITKYEDSIKWESSNHFHIIFLEDGSFIPIYRNPNQVPENFKKLIFLQTRYNHKPKDLAKIIKLKKYDIEDYSDMTHIQLLAKLNTYNKSVELDKDYAEDDYVMTPDNFLKMNLIYLRVQSGLPVIIMGETGCGKTSLIQFLVQKVLGKPKKRLTQDCLYSSSSNDDIGGADSNCDKSTQFAKISIHAGTTSNYIRNKMADLIEKAEKIGNEKLWVFFDEFNTTDSIGMICEIMCERTLDGNPLPANMAFLGACNPYRVSSKKGIQQNIGIDKSGRTSNKDKLVHIVKPLPETMIDYVWDFGTLTHEDARKYIMTMLNQIYSHFKELFAMMICIAHKHFQEVEDTSSVSLRDVSRFIDLFLWFRQSINDRKRELVLKYPKMEKCYSSDYEIEISAGILAFSHCYYLRIASDFDRQSFLHKVTETLRKPDLINVKKIIDLIETEQNDYISRMELPKGTALNSALKENIFTVIPCIVNKIPVFICGKPGSSKSLSIQLIFSNLRGKKSNDPYFRTLPELAMEYFQGSVTCKSEGIIEVFNKAGKYPKIGHEILPVVLFDEIGLAELSKHNPLKVLHSYLERENINVGFIGISNWRLDASKMNRALYLARPDPDERDLEFTALSIYHSYTDNKIYELVIKNLAKSYMGLKKKFQETINANFYGLRDFYHLIKNVSEKFATKIPSTNEDILKCVKTAIERNFGGTRHGTSTMCALFNEYNKINLPEEKSRTLDLIKDNLDDPNARYLMLIGKPDIATFILDKYLDKHDDRRIIIGSNLPNDINQDNYGFECLNDIIIYMELGISIILKDMNNIYSSLYDLFNQSFAVQGSDSYERKYCKISLGSNFNPRCYVHPKFHAIALISPDDIEKTDAPFLNRFEKHYLSIDTLLNEKQTDLLEKLESWINSFFVINEQEIVSFTKNHLFPIYSQETLALLILFNSQSKKKETLEKCIKILLEIAPSDILILLELISIDQNAKENINNTWKELHTNNFQDTIKSMIEDTSDFDKLIAFTYDKRISGKFFNTNDDEKIIIKEMIVFNSKQDLAKELNSYYQSEDKKVFILEVDFGEECNHLPLVKFLIDKLNSENPLSKKKFCIVIHMKRNIKYDSNIMLFESWKMKMFEGLLPNSFEATDEIISKNTRSLILSDLIFDFKRKKEHLAEKCMLSFKIEIMAENKDKFSSYLNNVIQTIGNDIGIATSFKEKIWNYLQTAKINKDWKEEIFLNSKIIDDSANLYEAISELLGKEIESVLQLIIYVLEERSALLSYVQPFSSPYVQFNDFRKQIWLIIFNSMRIDTNIGLQRLNQGNLLKYEYELYFPFSRMDYKAVLAAFNTYKISQVNENLIQTPLEIFTEEYHKLSIYKENIDFNGEHFELQDLYFNDLVTIYLKENLLSFDYKKLILILLKIIFHDDGSFEEKLISFMRIEKLGVLLCYAIDVLPELSNEVVKFLENILSNINSFEVNQDEDEDRQIWQIALSSVYKMLIGNMQPHIFNNQEFGVLEYSIKAEKLYNLLTEIELNERTSIGTLDILEFWVLFSKLIAKSQGKWETLLNLSYQASSIQIEGTLLIWPEGFANTVFGIVEDRYKNSSQYYKFMGSFLKLLVNHSPQYISRIGEELENEGFWQYSKKIMNIITIRSKIKNSVEKLKKSISDNMNADFELIKSKYLKEIERDLRKRGICSKLGIILSDNLEISLKDNKLDDQDEKTYRNKLIEGKKYFDYFLRAARNRDIKYSCVKQLISLIMVKNYLDIYCFVIAKKMILIDEENEIIEQIGAILYENDIGHTLKMHCVKTILSITGYDLSIFMADFSNFSWIRIIRELEEEKKPRIRLNLESFLVFPRISELYKNNVKILRNILNNIGDQNENDRILNEIQSPDQKLALGIAFLNEIFSIYSKENEMNQNIINWFNTKDEIIRTSLSQEFYQLFYYYVNNFPAHSDLRLERDTPEKDLHRILTILGISTVILSYNQRINPISSLFFNENGTIDNLAERFNSRYVFAAEPHPLHKYTQYILDNFESFITDTWSKKYSKGSTYKCSIDCDYIYIVTKCGGPTQESECPFCHRKIGGTRHKLIEREGHVNLSHREAHDFIESAVRRHREEAETGLKHFGSLIGEISSIRNLKPASYLSQHFVLSSFILALHQLGSIDDWTLELLINSSQLQDSAINCLKRSVKVDYEKLLELSGSNSGHLWEYKIISNMDDLLLECEFDPVSIHERDEFEIRFENKLILPNLNPQNSILEYSNLLRTNFEIQYSFKDYIYEFLSLNNDENYPFIELFRTKGEPSLENMKNQFLLNQSAKEFKLISIYLENSEEIEKIESLYPIIEFTNSLLDIYNHKIIRSDAYNISIGDAINLHPELQDLFTSFNKAWKLKGIDNLHYGCKDLDPMEFDMKSPLAYFLVDNKVRGAGMYMAAALIELAEIQNKYLSQINAVINSRDIEDQKKVTEYPLQKLKEQNILSLHIDDSELLKVCSFCNPIYGKGREIIYDFERMQKLLTKKLLLAKRIDTSRLDLIQYQFELLNTTSEESGLLLEIKEIIPQKLLLVESLHNIELFFSELEKDAKMSYAAKLKDIYTSFNYLMCYLRYSKGKNNYLIMDFCKELNSSGITTYLKERTRISEIKLEYIISLYQIVEAKYFQFTKNFINPEYKQTDKSRIVEDHIIELLNLCDNNPDMYPTKFQIEDALMRFIIRNSTADLQPGDLLGTYISRYDFWDLNVDQWKIDSLDEIFPNIEISHSLKAYEFLYARNHNIISIRVETSQRQVVAANRKSLKARRSINWDEGRD